MCKSCKPGSVKVDGEGLVSSAESVYAHIELPASEEEGVEEVALADVGFGRVVAVEGLPLGDVCDFVEDEDALALALAGLGKAEVRAS